jgi:hypothetical protein
LLADKPNEHDIISFKEATYKAVRSGGCASWKQQTICDQIMIASFNLFSSTNYWNGSCKTLLPRDCPAKKTYWDTDRSYKTVLVPIYQAINGTLYFKVVAILNSSENYSEMLTASRV